MSRDDAAGAARRRIETEHGETLAAVRGCAEAVAASWDDERTADRAAVVDPFEAALSESGTLAALPAVLESAVAATGRDLQAEPVAAPPYVAITSVGPVLRATLPDGRLVVTLRTFAVERPDSQPADGSGSGGSPTGPQYALAPSLAVEVEFRR